MSQPPPGPPGLGYQPWPQSTMPSPPTGTVALTLQSGALTPSLITPTVTVNGYVVAARDGRNNIPVPPGPVRVQVCVGTLLDYGHAFLDFTMQAQQVVPVFYATPLFKFATGSIGHEKQRRKGAGIYFGFCSVMLAALLLLTTLAIVN